MSHLELHNVDTHYGTSHILFDVSLDVNEGEVVCLLGRNGAGKTTSMECVQGLRDPDAGEISVLGHDPRTEIYSLQNRIGVQHQEAQLQKRIKVWEAIDLWTVWPDQTKDCA